MTRKSTPSQSAISFLGWPALVPAVCILFVACKPNAGSTASPITSNKAATPKSNDATEKLAQWEEKTAHNDPEAFLQLGLAYLKGNGKAKNDATAVEYFRKAADLGYLRAQNDLGLMYASGRGVSKDTAEALKWLRAAAGQGSLFAQENLASLLVEGQTLPRDTKEGLSWYEKAAEQGSVKAQRVLGRTYFFGENGVTKDYATAEKWLKLAADQKDGWSENTLGAMAEAGLGREIDKKAALEWYLLSAEQGDARGQSNAARLLGYHNQGIEEDKVEAYKWLVLSSEQGDTTASVPLQDFQFELGPAQLADARHRIAEYKKRHSTRVTE